MSAVVSDTSPVRALAWLGKLDILHDLFGQVLIPPAVQQELAVEVPGWGSISPGEFPFLVMRRPKGTDPLLGSRLGVGEAEAIQLALEVAAEYLLVDDGLARKAAVRRGLLPVGVLGLLARAKDRELIAEVKPFVEILISTGGFRLSPRVIAEALRIAGEHP